MQTYATRVQHECLAYILSTTINLQRFTSIYMRRRWFGSGRTSRALSSAGEFFRTRALKRRKQTGSGPAFKVQTSVEDRAAGEWEDKPTALSTLRPSYQNLGSCVFSMARENGTQCEDCAVMHRAATVQDVL